MTYNPRPVRFSPVRAAIAVGTMLALAVFCRGADPMPQPPHKQAVIASEVVPLAYESAFGLQEMARCSLQEMK